MNGGTRWVLLVKEEVENLRGTRPFQYKVAIYDLITRAKILERSLQLMWLDCLVPFQVPVADNAYQLVAPSTNPMYVFHFRPCSLTSRKQARPNFFLWLVKRGGWVLCVALFLSTNLQWRAYVSDVVNGLNSLKVNLFIKIIKKCITFCSVPIINFSICLIWFHIVCSHLKF
jgi:hypothetical protein